VMHSIIQLPIETSLMALLFHAHLCKHSVAAPATEPALRSFSHNPFVIMVGTAPAFSGIAILSNLRAWITQSGRGGARGILLVWHSAR